jgi:hypothetical protein
MRRAPSLSGAWSSAAIAWIAALSPIPDARAWYDHTVVMDQVLKRLEAEFPTPGEKATWTNPLPLEAIAPETRYYEIASLLLLQGKAARDLRSANAHSLHDLLKLGAEDPDHGIDADLPDSADPSDDRKYMGGTRGASSQGFRHMYWAGWNSKHPIATLQWPTRALGQSPDRIDLLANEARDRIRKGDLAWGGRILGWTIHYLQDLTQPFHTVQVPTLAMVPWRALFTWPPTDAIDSLSRESMRVITNYHWAYEGYIRHALLAGDANPFKECFEKSGGTLLVNSPRELALEIANRSVNRATETGDALVAFVGTHLREPAVSVPLNPGQVDVEDLLKNPIRSAARERLNAVTCESLRLSTDATIWITRWAFGR